MLLSNKRNKLLIYTRTWMNLKTIMLTEQFQLYDLLEKAKLWRQGTDYDCQGLEVERGCDYKDG